MSSGAARSSQGNAEGRRKGAACHGSGNSLRAATWVHRDREIGSLQMPDDLTRKFLAGLPRLKGFVRKPPSTVAISRSVIADHADESEHDLETAAAWIETHGGRLVKPPPVQSQSLRAGRRMERTVPADPYYIIPATALGE